MKTDEMQVWIQFFSTIFFVVTLAVLVWTTILQRKAIEVDEYADLRQHHHDLITLQIENKETLNIFNVVKIPDKYQGKKDNEIVLDEHEKQLFQVYLAEFDLYERVWLLKEEKEKLTESEWLSWIMYLETMSHHWLFRYCFNQTRMIFDSNFMMFVRENIIEPQRKKENAIDKIKGMAEIAYEKENHKKITWPTEVTYENIS